MRSQPELAREMTVKLANILRALLKDHDTYVPLREELNFTDDYLDIEVVRFGADKLRVEKEIDPRTLEVLVPSILLQPLIENSIKHGLEPRIHGGTVTLRSRLEGDRVLIEVADDGVGMSSRPPPALRRSGAGIGMKNVQERLEVLYGNQARFNVVSNPGRGTLVSIEIPADLPERAVEARRSASFGRFLSPASDRSPLVPVRRRASTAVRCILKPWCASRCWPRDPRETARLSPAGARASWSTRA